MPFTPLKSGQPKQAHPKLEQSKPEQSVPPTGTPPRQPHGRESFWDRLNRPLDAEDIERLLRPVNRPLAVNDLCAWWQSLRSGNQIGNRDQSSQAIWASLPWLLGSANLLCLLILMAFSGSGLALWLQTTGLFPLLAILALGISWAALFRADFLRADFLRSELSRMEQASQAAASSQKVGASSQAVKLAALDAPLSLQTRRFHLLVVAISLFGLCYLPQHGAEAAFINQGETVLPQWLVVIFLIVTASSLASWLPSFNDNLILESTERRIEILIPSTSIKKGGYFLFLAGLGTLMLPIIIALGWRPSLIVFCALIAARWAASRLLGGSKIGRLPFFSLPAEPLIEQAIVKQGSVKQRPGRLISLAAGTAGALYGLLWYFQAEQLFTTNPGAGLWWAVLTCGIIGIVHYPFVTTKESRAAIYGLESSPGIRVRLPEHTTPMTLGTALNLWLGRRTAFSQKSPQKIGGTSLQTFQQRDRDVQIFLSHSVQTFLSRNVIPLVPLRHSPVETTAGSTARPATASSITVQPATASSLFGSLTLPSSLTFAAAIGWLALKDWLTSDVQSYPYQSSVEITLVILIAAFAVRFVKNPGAWRDLLLVAAMGLLIEMHINAGLPWVVAVSNAGLPVAAVLSLALPPLFAGSRSLFISAAVQTEGSFPKHPLPKRPFAQAYFAKWRSRFPYALAALAGFTAMAVNSPFDLAGSAKWVSIVLVAGCVAAVLWSGTAFGRRLLPPAWSALPVFLLCGGLYMTRTLQAADVWASKPLDPNLRTLLVGTGLQNTALASFSSFIAEQGWVCWAIIGLLLLEAFCLSWDCLVRAQAGSETRQESTQESTNGLDGNASDVDASGVNAHGIDASGGILTSSAKRDAVELSASAAAVLVILLVHRQIASNTACIWVLAFGIASLAISGSGYRPLRQARRNKKMGASLRKLRLVTGALCILIPVCWIGALWGVAWFMAGSGTLPGAASFVPWRSVPKTLRDTLPSDMSVVESLQNVHNDLRHSFGSQIVTPLPMAAVVARRTLGTDRWNNPVSVASSSVLAGMISAHAPKERIKELYLNDLNYGAPGTGGLDQACRYYFHKEPADLTAADAHFLVGQKPTADSDWFRPAAVASAVVTPEHLSIEAAQYRYRQFDHIQGMYYMVHDGGVNARGEVASYVTTDHGELPYRWHDGRFQMLPPLSPGSGGAAVKLNDQGQAVGWSDTTGGNTHAVIWNQDGTVHDLGTLPGFDNSRAQAINNKGQVVGYAYNNTVGADASLLENAAHAFVWEAGRMHDLGVLPGCTSSRAYAINDAGQVAGWVLTAGNRTHAMVWKSGVMHDIGTFSDGGVSVANAINNAGQVVGSADHSGGTVTAFLWQNGVIHDLGALPNLGALPKDVYCRALGINDAGQVIGESRPDNNIAVPGGRPFLWDGPHGMRDLVPMLTLNAAQKKAMAHSCAALAINSSGEVLGLNRNSQPSGAQLQFVLLPHISPNRADRLPGNRPP